MLSERLRHRPNIEPMLSPLVNRVYLGTRGADQCWVNDGCSLRRRPPSPEHCVSASCLRGTCMWKSLYVVWTSGGGGGFSIGSCFLTTLKYVYRNHG